MIILKYLAVFSIIVIIVFAYATGQTFRDNVYRTAKGYKPKKYGLDMSLKQMLIVIGVLAVLALIVTFFVA